MDSSFDVVVVGGGAAGLSLCGASYRQVSVVGQWAEAGSPP